MESALATLNIPGMFRRLGLWDDVGSTITPSPPPPQPPLPMITYDQGLPSLPDDIICEILGLLDKEALKSCSLTGKAISCSAKPILHRTLYLTPGRPGVRKKPNAPGQQSEFKGLPILGERGLLQYTRHISISLPCNPLFPQDLRPHIQYLHTITNLRSLRTRWLDIPSFLLQMGEYFGTFLESLQSLELEFPRGDHNQILYFVSQFPNLRDLRIEGVQDYTHAMRNGGPHFDITASPPLNGTLDLQLNTWNDRGAQLVFYHLLTLPSGLKFRTLKLSGCTDHKPQLLVDACASTLECMDFTGQWYTETQCLPLNFEHNLTLRKLEIKLVERARAEHVAAWLSKTLSTITSNAFTELTICIAQVSYSFDAMTEDQVRGWNSADNVLDRLSLCEDVTLVVRRQHRVAEDKFKKLVEKYFPLMWENGRVVLEGSSPDVEDGSVRRTRISGPGWIF